ncbi:DUF6193 family natural product biosynthesis protein [Streptomyces sp. NPDC048479]|uniref:DUF6193 family natural product biosynthesis protein n=1 Tax=Streptomyces sp. NPDC048479 TaxID=3154725 RepID=UPI003445E39C
MTSDENSRNAAEIVAAEWRYYLEEDEGLVDPATVRAAYAQPRLRELYPGVSHGTLYLKPVHQSPCCSSRGLRVSPG